MGFKNKRVRSVRRQISVEIRKAKICFYENKVYKVQTHQKPPQILVETNKCLIGEKSVEATMLDSSTGLQMDDKLSACCINNFFGELN